MTGDGAKNMKSLYSPKSAKPSDFSALTGLLLLFAISVLFWDTIYLYPIKIFVVILHEISHGMAAVLTGGHIDRIEINAAIGGVCWTSGGHRGIILSAGYLGSMLWGSLILFIAAKTKYDNILGIFIGGGLILIALFFIRNFFGFLFTMVLGLLMIILCVRSNNTVADFLMKFIGMTSALYVIIDIKSDLIDRTVDGNALYSGMKSDAFALAEYLGFPQLSVFIGSVWMIIAILVFLRTLAAVGSGKIPQKGSGDRS